ncbi:MAG: response regulator [Gammaproteobacteria bacterium]|nr:response regulator [Gammaproteobacteria bacterium]
MTDTSGSQEQKENKPTVLIVDDSRVIRVSMKKILGDEYNVLEAEDGEDGWAQIRAHKDVRCVFTDYSMPELDGFGLLARIKGSSNPQVNQLPVVLVTGAEDDSSIQEEAKKSGFADIVMKPFKPGGIRQCVVQFFPEKQVKEAPAADSQELAALNAEVERLKTQGATLIARAEQAEKARLETGQEVVRLKAELEMAQLSSASNERFEKEVGKAKEELTRVQAQLLSMTNRAESAEAAHRKVEQEIMDVQADLNKRQSDFAQQLLGKEEEAKEAQKALKAARQKLEEAEAARQKSDDEIKQLRTTMLIRQQGAEVEKNERVDALTKELEALSKELETARTAAQQARKEQQEAKQGAEKLESELGAARKAQADAAEEQERTKRMMERLRQDREDAVTRAESSEESLAHAEKAMEELRSEMEKARSSENETDKLKESMTSMRAEVDSLRIDKEAAEAAQSEVENELVSMAAALESMEKLKEAAEARTIELQAALNDRREEEIKRRSEEAKQPKEPSKPEEPKPEVKPAPAPTPEPKVQEKPNKEEPVFGEVVEMSGFWPDSDLPDDPDLSLSAEDKPVSNRKVPPREPEVMPSKGPGAVTIAGMLVGLLLVGAAGAYFFGLIGEDEVPPAEVASKPADEKSLPAGEEVANKGTVTREAPAPVKQEVEKPPVEVPVVSKPEVEAAETTQVATESTQQVAASQPPVAEKTTAAPAPAKPVFDPATLPGLDAPVAVLESPFNEQSAKTRDDAEAEFKSLMSKQQGGVIPAE